MPPPRPPPLPPAREATPILRRAAELPKSLFNVGFSTKGMYLFTHPCVAAMAAQSSMLVERGEDDLSESGIPQDGEILLRQDTINEGMIFSVVDTLPSVEEPGEVENDFDKIEDQFDYGAEDSEQPQTRDQNFTR